MSETMILEISNDDSIAIELLKEENENILEKQQTKNVDVLDKNINNDKPL